MATAVYLVHYNRARAHFRHALRRFHGSVAVLRRLHRHLAALNIDPLAERQGIAFLLVRTWKGQDENFERRVKRQKHHSRLCPVCNPAGYARRTTKMLRSG